MWRASSLSQLRSPRLAEQAERPAKPSSCSRREEASLKPAIVPVMIQDDLDLCRLCKGLAGRRDLSNSVTPGSAGGLRRRCIRRSVACLPAGCILLGLNRGLLAAGYAPPVANGMLKALAGLTLLSTVMAKKGANISSQVIFP